jgi:hypothetical protein
MEYFHIIRELASKLVYAWDESLKVIAVLYPSYLSELLDSFSFQAD